MAHTGQVLFSSSHKTRHREWKECEHGIVRLLHSFPPLLLSSWLSRQMAHTSPSSQHLPPLPLPEDAMDSRRFHTAGGLFPCERWALIIPTTSFCICTRSSGASAGAEPEDGSARRSWASGTPMGVFAPLRGETSGSSCSPASCRLTASSRCPRCAPWSLVNVAATCWSVVECAEPRRASSPPPGISWRSRSRAGRRAEGIRVGINAPLPVSPPPGVSVRPRHRGKLAHLRSRSARSCGRQTAAEAVQRTPRAAEPVSGPVSRSRRLAPPARSLSPLRGHSFPCVLASVLSGCNALSADADAAAPRLRGWRGKRRCRAPAARRSRRSSPATATWWARWCWPAACSPRARRAPSCAWSRPRFAPPPRSKPGANLCFAQDRARARVMSCASAPALAQVTRRRCG